MQVASQYPRCSLLTGLLYLAHERGGLERGELPSWFVGERAAIDMHLKRASHGARASLLVPRLEETDVGFAQRAQGVLAAVLRQSSRGGSGGVLRGALSLFLAIEISRVDTLVD